MITAFVVLAIGIDYLLGEPKKYHPLVLFGNLVAALEKKLNRRPESLSSIVLGGFALLALTMPALLIAIMVMQLEWLNALMSVLVLYWAIGLRSLKEHSMQVYLALQDNDLEQAKQKLSWMVSRETDSLTVTQVNQATIESVLENGNDAVFAPIFWFCVAGLPAVLFYRLVNTLDAMWGYRTERYNYFGRVAARVDDVLNYIPARLVAVSYVLLGHFKPALKAWKNQAQLLKSPNAGPVMTAGAGSLNVKLGGPTVYHGKLFEKPSFGGENEPNTEDILRANLLINKTTVLWCIVIALISLAFGSV